jgi:hypothetical protein
LFGYEQLTDDVRNPRKKKKHDTGRVVGVVDALKISIITTELKSYRNMAIIYRIQMMMIVPSDESLKCLV